MNWIEDWYDDDDDHHSWWMITIVSDDKQVMLRWVYMLCCANYIYRYTYLSWGGRREAIRQQNAA